MPGPLSSELAIRFGHPRPAAPTGTWTCAVLVDLGAVSLTGVFVCCVDKGGLLAARSGPSFQHNLASQPKLGLGPISAPRPLLEPCRSSGRHLLYHWLSRLFKKK